MQSLILGKFLYFSVSLYFSISILGNRCIVLPPSTNTIQLNSWPKRYLRECNVHLLRTMNKFWCLFPKRRIASVRSVEENCAWLEDKPRFEQLNFVNFDISYKIVYVTVLSCYVQRLLTQVLQEVSSLFSSISSKF